ncbi:minor histocompatibility antigen H13 [Cryptococcus deuterogattii 99/473]|uniref:Minor histocompatibility antigen H13 n=1 Tax=Cryptococcus deuterogattii Ram5 TaxID=1296110 RepID=A0A0D0TVP9_9TREE|nr:minor histocompatibility antigen H13 [Cryptococcus deuterogattii Ram5]KIY55751.1 minor histocompatibility antigen H13 [Cryptococcus deuterogattii 99/473]
MPQDNTVWVTYASLGVQALIPIAIGSFKSLQTPEDTRRRLRESKKGQISEEYDDDYEEPMGETLTWKESAMFPILGSVMLLGLWAVLKYFGKKWITIILGVYFGLAGMLAVQSTFSSIIAYLLRVFGISTTTYHVRISAGFRQIFHLPTTLPTMCLVPISVVLPLLYVYFDRHYILSNILALAFSIETLALLKLDSFFTAFLMLGLLLIYDIFWVFATPVMVTVAKGIDAPIKILAPKTSPFASPTDFAMLGLGDIIVPGLVIALCLRYDLHRYAVAYKGRNVTPRSKFGKPYFWCGVRAQPALLYLSPACTLGPVLLAFAQRDIRNLWTYDESLEENKKVLDDTIESASEAAIKARAEAKAAAEETVSEGEANVGEAQDARKQKGQVEDDKWMDNTGVIAPEGKAKKKKSGKKK